MAANVGGHRIPQPVHQEELSQNGVIEEEENEE